MLNYGAPSWFYGEITEFGKQTVVRELLLCRHFRYRCSFMYAAVSFISYIYSGKRCNLAEGKRLGGETVGLQYPVWLLRNTDSNVNKYFELKNSWGANRAPLTRTTC